MAERRGSIVGLAAAGLLLLAGCEHIPYYDESLNWFSSSKYDPEVETIETDVPPPGRLQAPVAPAAPAGQPAPVRDGRGGPVTSQSPPDVGVSLGASPVARGGAVAAAGRVSVADGAHAAGADGAPLVGIRNSVGGSVTWRSSRGG